MISNRITFGPRGAALQWARATETGIKGYHIERSHEPGFPDWSYLPDARPTDGRYLY
ncbi:hypothetical protein ACFSC4_30325 [Deinococcus malanensis]|uniref:hypothetical protein n=1 Tax=Deinococcus malanensis TaxID=1706855 RepID=UPI00362611DB